MDLKARRETVLQQHRQAVDAIDQAKFNQAALAGQIALLNEQIAEEEKPKEEPSADVPPSN